MQDFGDTTLRDPPSVEVPEASKQMPIFDLAVRHEAGRAIVAVQGELDIATAPTLAARLTPLTAGDIDIDIDLRDLTFISCAGVTVLLDAARALADRGELVLRSPTPRITLLLDLVNLRDQIRIEP